MVKMNKRINGKDLKVTRQVVLNLTETDEETLCRLRGIYGVFPKRMFNDLGEIILWYLEELLNKREFERYVNNER